MASRNGCSGDSRGPAILCWHGVSLHGDDEYHMHADAFEQQLSFLNACRPVLPLYEFVSGLCNGILPPSAVALTFDDGCANFFRVAAPRLARAGFRATAFVVTSWVDAADPRLPHEARLLTWEELRKLASEGFEIGSHSVAHNHLLELNPEEARQEIAASPTSLRKELGEKQLAFAYPFGEQNEGLQEVVRSNGYYCGVAAGRTRAGRWALPRIVVLPKDDVATLALRLLLAPRIGPC